MYYFQSHGSKNWANVVPWDDSNTFMLGTEHLTYGTIIMHDQEPFDINNSDNFYGHLTNKKTLLAFKEKHPEYSDHYDRHYNLWGKRLEDLNYDITPIEFISLFVRTTKIPIICHSEKNSFDIKYLEDHDWISCYYWWHGMIARDWFRHWQWNNHLQIRNKAREPYRFLIYSRDFTGTRKYRKKIIDHLATHQTQVNYNWDQSARCPTLSATIDIDDANNSAIHLVAETLFDTEKIYLTEKVFKPMVMCQPFILFAPPGSLQYLRDYGFKTFDMAWSEDYDQITDAKQRKNAVLNLIDSLAAMSITQFEQMYLDLLPIIEHNKRHFYSAEFQAILWNEMQKNCNEALLKQQELSKKLPGGIWVRSLNQVFERTGYYSNRWHNALDYFIKNNHVNANDFKKNYPKLFKHYQSQ